MEPTVGFEIDSADFADNWHLEDICDHMKAVARGC